MSKAEKSIFVLSIIHGIIQGIVAYFSNQCRDGLIGFVDGGYAMIDNIQIYYPDKVMKF